MERHPDGLLLDIETYNALVKTVQRDCRVSWIRKSPAQTSLKNEIFRY
jgi:hypothetical protein